MSIEPIPAADPVGQATILPAHETYRRLRLAGFDAREAASLVAHIVGLGTVRGGWAAIEVERLLFVAALVRAGRIGS